MIDNELIPRLEFKIYRFSVNVFSFVKTLIDKKLSDKFSQALLNDANNLYASYVNLMDSLRKNDGLPDLTAIIKKSEECVSVFQNIELTGGALLNEKVDLAIEAHEISQLLKSLRTERI